LVDADERLAVLPATYAGPGLGAVLRAYDTVVLLKPGADREALRRVIADAGATAVWVQRVGRPEQRITRDLATLPAGDYFSLLIVRGSRHRAATASTPKEAAGQ
jgi:precorrin-2/cobalt-factor-2 C20-methyltransferase